MIDSILPLPASLVIAGWTLAYTPPNSRLRLLAGLLIAILNWIAARSTVARSFPGFIAPEYILGFILLSNNWLNLAQLHYKSPAKGYESPSGRLKWAADQVFSTRWGVLPSLIPFFDKNRPQWVPSRIRFLLWKIWTMIWCGALIYLVKDFEPLDVSDVISTPSGVLHRLSDVTFREAWLRVYTALEVMVKSYCCLCLMHAVCGFIAVGVFMDDPAGWRPLHGSPLEAVGMRGFYQKFWHHCMRKGFTSHAVFLVNDVLRLPRRSVVARYLIVTFSFLISGVYHAALAPEVPLQCSMLQLGYQLKVVSAIVFEDIVGILWTRFAPRSLRLQDKEENTEGNDAPSIKTSALSSAQDSSHPDLRRRDASSNTKEYPTSPMSITTPVKESKMRRNNSMKWTTIIIYGISYAWTVAFLVWANSSLVWSTNKCAVDLMWSEDDKEAWFALHGVNEPF